MTSAPSAVHRFARVLIDAEHAAYLVGGAVRNLLQERPPVDWDIATDATPDRVQRLYRRTIPTGIRHGTVTVLFAGECFEVTTFRTESTYSDGRRPNSVSFARTIEEDLARRDFTINAMAVDLASGALCDPHGGRADLAAQRLRTVGSARERFAEDGLRPFRGCRLVAELALTVDKHTLQAMQKALPTARRVAAERICEELRRLLRVPKPSVGLHVLARSGLMELCFGELNASEHAELFSRIDAVSSDVTRRLAMLLTPADSASFDAATAAGRARVALARLRFPNTVVDRIAAAIASLAMPITSSSSDGDIRRLLAAVGRSAAEDAIAVRQAQAAIDAPLSQRVRVQANGAHALSIQELAVNGTELQHELGLRPGPVIGRLLNALLQEVLEDPDANNRRRLLASASALQPPETSPPPGGLP